MADIDKIVAAILTAGRVPTLWDKQPRPREDWVKEYQSLLTLLETRRHEDQGSSPDDDETEA